MMTNLESKKPFPLSFQGFPQSFKIFAFNILVCGGSRSSRRKMLLDPISIDQWATENSHCFAPPIMNKLMHKKYALLVPLILPSTQERPSRLPHDSLLTPFLAQAAHHHVCWRPQHEDRLSRRGRIRAVHHDEGKYVGETTPRHSLARSPSRTHTASGLRNAESSV